ncbi:hypothetical protein RvY_05413 [Ramazzottius varieornatus]|uniref:TatD n=1 Tax=Ramazzottius varieornatus TaxID=947166 RepID=A0A1D1V4R3_RAMVA|nr:hypothetical protein RvY_05413 [Ramazzottius varieornatus]
MATEDREVSVLINKDTKKTDDTGKKPRMRSPSQSPTTVRRAEELLGSGEDREKWKSSNMKWTRNIEEGFFSKIEKQFDASVNGYGADNGIDLDLSCCTEDDSQSSSSSSYPVPADPAVVAAEYWQEVTAKATVTKPSSRNQTVPQEPTPHHNAIIHSSSGSFNNDRSLSESPASSLRSAEPASGTLILQRNHNTMPATTNYPPRLDVAPSLNTVNGYGDQRQPARSPGILPYNPSPSQRMSGGGGRIQTGYLRNSRVDNERPSFDLNDRNDRYSRDRDDYGDSRGRNNYSSNYNNSSNRSSGEIGLGPYESMFRNPLPGNVKFIDSHAHWCFTIKKLQSQGVENYHDLRKRYPEMFPPSYGGSIQVFCLPLYLKSYDHWHRKLIEDTEDELWFTYGCHPNFVDDWTEDIRSGMQYSMKMAAERGRLVGLGEIGLDYNRQNNNEKKKRLQRDIFKLQLEMAVRMDLPLVIHCRNDESPGGNNQAEIDCFDIMKQCVPHQWKIHRHCFRGNYNEASKWDEAFPNVQFGFTPCIGGNKDVMARDAVKNLPLEKMLLETDAPYYTPAAMSNFPVESSGDKQPRKVAIPGGIALVTAHEISRIKDIPLETVCSVTRENTIKLYGLNISI